MNKKINMREIDITAAKAREALETDETREAEVAVEAAIKQQVKETTANVVKKIVAGEKRETKKVTKERLVALEAGKPRIITEIQKNNREKIIISVKDFAGHKFVDLRIHYKQGEEEYLDNPNNTSTGPSYRPTKKGITIKPDISQQVIKAIHEGVDLIKADEATATK